jgi:hypothetical protein
VVLIGYGLPAREEESVVCTLGVRCILALFSDYLAKTLGTKASFTRPCDYITISYLPTNLYQRELTFPCYNMRQDSIQVSVHLHDAP